MARFIPTFWLETYTRLNASKPAQMIRLHRPQSALMAGLSEGKRLPYRVASKVASEAHSASETSAESCESSDYTCDECGNYTDDCDCCGECNQAPDNCNCCGECGMRPRDCECCDDEREDAHVGAVDKNDPLYYTRKQQAAGGGAGAVRLVGDSGQWGVKWAGDPQAWRGRWFTKRENAEACKRAIETYMSEGEFLGAGRHRASFLVGGLVVKVAMCDDGLQANSDEVRTSSEAPVPVPETAPLCAVSILAEFAPRMDPKEARAYLNSPGNPFNGFWVDADDFGPQIGKLPNGKIVCFDFSNC